MRNRGYTLIRTLLRKNPVSVEHGYTLIEILVSLTIVGIIFGVGYVAFRDFARRQTINTTIRLIIGDLRLAQTEAIAGTKPDQAPCLDPSLLNAYTFEITSTTSYRIRASCSSGELTIKEVILTEGVSITAPSPNPIFFKALGQGTNIPSGQTSINITAQGLSGSVVITAGGVVE